jgi:hypothetical protein
MKNIFLLSIIVCTILSCSQKKPQQQPSPETPKALQESGSSEYSLLSKSSRREDLVESLYAELVNKTPALKDIENQITWLDDARTDSAEAFTDFNQKSKDYYANAENHLSNITDSALKDKIRLIISNSQSKYNTQIAGHKNLLSTLDSKSVKLQDMHVLLKIAKTLPLIDNYQKENLPDKKPIEKVITEFDKTLNKIDSAANH